MSESLGDKLKSLGLSLGSSLGNKSAQPRSESYDISKVIKGEELETIYGKVFYTENIFPIDYMHGDINLIQSTELEILLKWAKVSSPLNTYGPSDFVFLDTETSGLSGGTGTYAFMIGLGHFTETGFRVVQLFMRDPSQEQALLAAITHFLSGFKGVVTFNGKTFDIPLLNGRHVLIGLSSPFKDMPHIDLLPLSRRIWRNRLDDRSLKNLEAEVLGVSRSQEEVPGWMVPELYFDYLKTLDARPLEGVFYHNLVDIVSLAALFVHTSHLLAQPLKITKIDSLDLIAIAKLYEEMDDIDVAIDVYERALVQGLSGNFFVQTIMRYADIYRKQNNWELAVLLWERAIGYRQIDPAIELAKYYEHQKKDFSLALQWVVKAQEWVTDLEEPFSRRDQIKSELDKRYSRLIKKISMD